MWQPNPAFYAWTTKPCEPDATLAAVGAGAEHHRLVETERQLLASLSAANAELQRANDAKTRLLTNASHELRTPLTALRSSLEVLQDQRAGSLNQKQRRFISLADRNAAKLCKLIDNLLDLSRIDAQRMKLQIIDVDLNDVVSEALPAIEQRAEHKAIQIHLSLDPDLPVLAVDPDRMEEILVNLLGNAVKYTPCEGDVWLSAHAANDAHIEIAVRDNGPGIPEADLARLFEPFYRVDRDNAPRVEGSGLGLAITRKLVRLHGGRIQVSSTLEETPGRLRRDSRRGWCDRGSFSLRGSDRGAQGFSSSRMIWPESPSRISV